MLFKALITNIHLECFNIRNSNACTFCNNQQETIKHLFYDCTKIQAFWTNIVNWLSYPSPLSWKQILFNKVTPNPKQVQNLIILAAKNYIYATRCLSKDISFEAFKCIIYDLESTEKFIAFKNGKSIIHNRKWNNFVNE